MAMEFTTANTATEVGGVKVLTHGGPGSGKTVLMATMPSPIVISAEAGLLSLRKANLERIFGVGNPHIEYDVKVIKVSNVDDLTQAHAWCAKNAWTSGFRSVGLDSISEIMEQVLANAKQQVKDPRQAYGELIEKGQMLVRAFRDLPGLNVCVAAKQEPAKDEMTGITRYGPSVPGAKLGPSLPYFFDEVFALRIGKQQDGTMFRYMQTQPDLQYEAKDRSGLLAEMEYPHLGAVFSKVLAA